jgi:hypothetical protein
VLALRRLDCVVTDPIPCEHAMPTPKMPDRTVPAANADLLGEDARTDGTLEGLVGGAGKAGESVERGQAGGSARGEARPGKDENQAGFLKEKDQPGA